MAFFQKSKMSSSPFYHGGTGEKKISQKSPKLTELGHMAGFQKCSLLALVS